MNSCTLNPIAPTSLLSIGDIAQQAMSLGYLTIEAENQLRYLLRQKYGKADLMAFMQLQAATMAGTVRQESRDRSLVLQP